MENKKKSKYLPLGAVMVNREPDQKGRKQYYLKFDSKADVIINGENFSGKIVQVSRPTDKFDRMLANGSITEEEYNDKVSRYSPEGDLSFISLEVTAKLS